MALYLVYGDLRVPWVYRLWRGEGEKSLSLLAPRLLAALPPWMRKAFGIRVVADAAFGTLCFRTGAQGMGLEAVVGMRRDRRTREGQRLLNLRRQGSGLSGLGQWVPLPSGSGGVWCHLSRPRKGRRRFRIGHFFKAMNSGFSLGRFGQRTPLGARRFLVLRFLAYLLAHWVRMEQEGEGLTWREAARESLRLLLPGLVAQAALGEPHAPGLWHPPPDEVRGKAGLCRLCRRCKF